MNKDKEYNILDDLKNIHVELSELSDNLDSITMYIKQGDKIVKASIQEIYDYIQKLTEQGLQAHKDQDYDKANMYFDIVKEIQLS